MQGATQLLSLNFDFEEFQSTLPMQGATQFILTISEALKFQSTLPMQGATRRLPDTVLGR